MDRDPEALTYSPFGGRWGDSVLGGGDKSHTNTYNPQKETILRKNTELNDTISAFVDEAIYPYIQLIPEPYITLFR